MKVFGRWESDEDDVYNLHAEPSNDDISRDDKEEDFWVGEDQVTVQYLTRSEKN